SGTDRQSRGSPHAFARRLSETLARAADLRWHDRCRRQRRLHTEEVLLIQSAVNVAGYARRQRPDRWPSARQQNYHHKLAAAALVERSEPAQMRAAFAAGTGLAKDFGFLARPPRGSKCHRAPQSRLHRRDQICDIQPPLNLRLEITNLFLRLWILQPIECAAVRDRRHERREFQGGLRNLFPEARQHPHTAILRRLRREVTRMLALNIHAGLFAVAEQL